VDKTSIINKLLNPQTGTKLQLDIPGSKNGVADEVATKAARWSLAIGMETTGTCPLCAVWDDNNITKEESRPIVKKKKKERKCRDFFAVLYRRSFVFI